MARKQQADVIKATGEIKTSGMEELDTQKNLESRSEKHDIQNSQIQYEKSQFLTSAKYKKSRDLVDALLEEEKKYTIEEADKLIGQFMKGKVR